jgi:hypothetical protein
MADIEILTRYISVVMTIPVTIYRTDNGYMAEMDNDYLEDSQGNNCWDSLEEAQEVINILNNRIQE